MPQPSELRIVDPVISNLLLGYQNAEFISEALFPVVTIGKMTAKVPKWGSEHFKIFDTIRAARAETNEAEIKLGTPVTVSTDEHDIAHPLDVEQEINEAADAFQLRKNATFSAMRIIQMKREYTAAALAFDAAQYAASNKVTLSGTTQWTHASSDPVSAIDTGKAAVSLDIGVDPNTLVLGYDAFKALRNNAAILDRVKYTNPGQAVTLAILANLFDVERVVVGKANYATDAGVMTRLWGDKALLAWVPPGEMRDPFMPSYGYTFRRAGGLHGPYPQAYRYYSKNGKVEYNAAEDNFEVKIVGADAGYLISDTNV